MEAPILVPGSISNEQRKLPRDYVEGGRNQFALVLLYDLGLGQGELPSKSCCSHSAANDIIHRVGAMSTCAARFTY